MASLPPGANLSRLNLSGADLSEAYLSAVNLLGADLSRAYLRGAYLRGADLSRAYLSGADLSETYLSVVNFRGADLSDASLGRANLRNANLSDANLSGADLSGADLRGADLSRTNLSGANLSDANLNGADLSRANLSGTKLAGADLNRASLSDANLRGADLSRASLSGADLSRTTLTDASLSGAKLGHTLLVRTNLEALCSAQVTHHAPSTVDIDSVLLSVRSPNLKSFLIRAGMPEVYADYMVDIALSLKTDIFKMLQSTFISYGAPDEAFARKLHEGLQRNGVTTFFFPEHAEPGEKLHRMMRKGVNDHDRVILVCSRNSLDRKGVLNELEEILTREARDGGASYLIPIRLDDYVFTGWKPPNADVAQAVRDRVVADFEDADKDDAKFQAGLQKLLKALRKKTLENVPTGRR